VTESGAGAGTSAADTVGAQLRLLRRARRQTLRQVAQRARVSESFLSQLERGRTGASIASLQGIAGALGVEVSDLFARNGDTGPRVLRREDRPYVSWGTLGRKALLTPKPFEALEVVAASFERGGSTGPDSYVHGDSEELLVVVSGVVELMLGEETMRLGAGDCARYRSSMPHRLVNAGEETAEVMYIMSPPSY
jgi:transcriptional regulator with XRE-family HTH domain